MKENRFKILSSNNLKMLAIILMFCDHLGKSLLLNYGWLTYIGRLAFPLFAFLVAEGYNNTSNFKKYFKRMLIYALISEIPFNLLFGGVIYLGGANVLFTFVIALVVIRVIDLSWKKDRVLGVGVGILATLIGFLVATLIYTDYYGPGVIIVVGFWLFGKIKFGWILQILVLLYINWVVYAGECFVIVLSSYEFLVPIQSLAVFSMIPILMYNGMLGRGGEKFKKFAYIFYPVHMAMLGILMIFIS